MGYGMVTTAITISNVAYEPSRLANDQTRTALADSARKIASGNRIIQISDDVRAVTQSSVLQGQSSAFTQAQSNAAKGSTLLDTASEGLSQINDVIENLQLLAEQAAGTSITDQQRLFLQQQFVDAISSIDTIVSKTSFNDITPLSGFTSDFKIGPQPTDTISVSIADVTSTGLFGGTLPDISTVADATAAQTNITDANNILQGVIDYVEGVKQGFNAAAAALTQTSGGSSRVAGDLINTDTETEQQSQTNNVIRLNTGTAVLAQATRLQPQLLQLLHSAAVQPQPQKQDTQDQSGQDDQRTSGNVLSAIAARISEAASASFTSAASAASSGGGGSGGSSGGGDSGAPASS